MQFYACDDGLIISRIEHLIRAVAADDYRAELLDVDPGGITCSK